MNELINRIPKQYVSENDGCAQVMISYQDSMTIFDKNGILFNQDSEFDFINHYLEDERRNIFPFSNIPNHIKRHQWFGRRNVANQLFNFNEHYITVCDGLAIDRCVLFDKGDALMMTKVFPNKTSDESEYSNKKVRMNREELDNMFKPNNENEKVYIATSTGDIYHSAGMGYQQENYFLEQQREKFTEQFEACKDRFSKDTIEFFERKLKEMDLNDLKNYPLPPSFYLIRMNGSEITIKLIYSIMIGTNNYDVTIKVIPLSKYVLEQFKYMAPNIVELKDPKISLRLNPGVTRDDLREAREMSLRMRNQ